MYTVDQENLTNAIENKYTMIENGKDRSVQTDSQCLHISKTEQNWDALTYIKISNDEPCVHWAECCSIFFLSGRPTVVSTSLMCDPPTFDSHAWPHCYTRFCDALCTFCAPKTKASFIILLFVCAYQEEPVGMYNESVWNPWILDASRQKKSWIHGWKLTTTHDGGNIFVGK